MAWRLAEALKTLRSEVQGRWPGTTVWTIGDAAHRNRASDHNENSQGVVCAVDIVDRAKAQVVWDHILSTRDNRVKYAIFRGQIVSSTTSPWQVRSRGRDPNKDHGNHIHVSVGRGPSGQSTRPDLYDDKSPWGLGKEKGWLMALSDAEQQELLDKTRAIFTGLFTKDDKPAVAAATGRHQSVFDVLKEARGYANSARELGHVLKNLTPESELSRTLTRIEQRTIADAPTATEIADELARRLES